MPRMNVRQQMSENSVPSGGVSIWWLGQNGWVIKSPAGKLIAIDPYLTNACKAVGASAGINMDRMVPTVLDRKSVV